MDRSKIFSKLPAIIIVTIIILFIIVINSNTRGIPLILLKKNAIDSIQLKYQSQTVSINDSFAIHQLASKLKSSQRFKADRINLNKSLIVVNFYLSSGNDVQLHIIDNVIHGNLLVSGWIYYKNNDFIASIKQYTSK